MVVGVLEDKAGEGRSVGIGQKFGLNLFQIFYRLLILIMSTLLMVHYGLFVSFLLMLPTLMLPKC